MAEPSKNEVEIEVPEGLKTRGVSRVYRSGGDLVLEYNTINGQRSVFRAPVTRKSVSKTLETLKKNIRGIISDRLVVQAIETLISDNESKLGFGSSENASSPEAEGATEKAVKALVREGDSGSLEYVLTSSGLYANELTIRAEDTKRDRIEILSRAPLLTKRLSIDGRELLEVTYGQDKILGNVVQVQTRIQEIGGICSSQHFRPATSELLEKQRNGLDIEYAYPTVGIYTDKDGRFVMALPQLGNVYPLDSKEFEVANFITEDVAKLMLPDEAKTRECLQVYVKVPSYYTQTDGIREDQVVRLLGYGIMQPFVYQLKAWETSGYFCPYLLNGGRGLGKSALINLITRDMFGIMPASVEAINTPFKLLQNQNATTLPQHVAEIQNFDFNFFAPIIKTAAEPRNRQGYRGNADQSVNPYEARSNFMLSSNRYKANEGALLDRILVDNVSGDEKSVKARHATFVKEVEHKVEHCLIGYEILRFVIRDFPTPQVLLAKIHELSVSLEVRAAELMVSFTGSRRILTYATMLFGIHTWAKFVREIEPSLADDPNIWFNKYSELDVFLNEIVKPLETQAVEVLRQAPIEVFRGWLISWCANEGLREEGDSWARLETEDAIYVAAGVLQKYKEHAKRAGEAPYESLKALAMDLMTLTGKHIEPNMNPIGLVEQRDSDDKIIKQPKPEKKRYSVKVPLGMQAALDVHLDPEREASS